MLVTFRELIKEDIDACKSIIKNIYKEDPDKEIQILEKDLLDVFNKAYPSKFLVSLINNEIVGFGCYLKIPNENQNADIFYKISWINISPQKQGVGIGKKLINELEYYIKKDCKENVYVLLETNKPDFYKKLGYYTYNKNGDNDVMQKFLPKIFFPKILIGTLFSEVKDYCIKEWFKNVCSLTYPNIDLCIVDNSKNKKYYKKIRKYFSEHNKNSNIKNITVLHTPRIDKSSEIFMTFSANELRKFFLNGNYDWLLNLECDIFPPSDIIERLLCYNKSVIGVTYFSGEKKMSYPMIVDMSSYKNFRTNDNMPYIQGFYQMTNTFEPNPCFSQGIGCTLIHNSILNKIKFRSSEHKKVHYDVSFSYDLKDNGIKNYLVPIICRHENKIWDIQNKLMQSV